MSVPGQFGVSATGAATYSVPIAVPPGTAGMVPALSLDYSSQGIDGIVGWQWSLDGLPVITRCARAVQEDSVKGGVNYDNNDRFCLDGQRLMVISGTYGAANSEYRTEIDTFSKIVAYGTAGNGPSYFKIWTKSGRVLELGNTTDSKILAVGKSTVRVWAVNKISDTKGNYLTVTYTNDTTYGQYYPTRIDYTGNANTSLSTYNSVQFTYNTSRVDVTPTYQAGSLIETTVLLTDVKTYQGSNLVNDYQLAYRAGTSTTHSRLTSVTLCDGSSHCLAPTTFGWQGGSGLPTMTSTANSLAQGTVLQAGDFNADGLTDALAGVASTTSCTSGGFIYLGSNAGTFSSGSMTMAYTYWPPPNHSATAYSSWACYYRTPGALLGDINGDGYTDMFLQEVYWQLVGGSWEPFPISNALLNTETGGLNQANLNTSRAQFALIGDFNGDGRMDGYLQSSTTSGNAYFSNGDGTFTADGGESGLGTNSTIMAGDFDGDGCTDMLAQGGTNAIVYFCNPATSSVSVSNWSGSAVYLGDFNGDGKTDILVVGSSGATLYLSTGTGLSSGYSISGSSTWSSYAVVTGDWNGDGKTDIALISHTSGTSHLIFLSTGTGFTQVNSISNSDTNAAGVVADWNNDGASDIWLQKSSGDTEYLFSYSPEEMTTISNGVGQTTTITYDRLNKNGSFYSKATSPGYPTLQLDGPYYVVSQVDTSNGIGGNYTLTYSYTGAFGNAGSYFFMGLSGAPMHGFGSVSTTLTRGALLGFSQIAVTDSQTSIVTTTSYSTTYPYVGMVTSQTRTHSGTTLSSVTYTLENVSLGSGRYFVGVHQSVVSGHDLNGASLPTTTTTTTYDCDSSPCYGNATQVAVSVSDGSSRTTTNTYTNDTTNWFIGELTASNVESVVGSSDLTRHLSLAYDSGSGLLTQAILESSNCEVKLQADYTLDSYGNRTATQLSGAGCSSDGYKTAITTRTSHVGYDSAGEFPTSTTNALSQSDSTGFSAAFGEPSSHTDLNGQSTSWSYDGFGRPTLETRPDGTKTSASYAYCSGVNGGSASCPTYGAYLMQTEALASNGTTQIGPIITTYYDALGRVIAHDTQGFDGSTIRSATTYDSNGRVHQTSRPYFTSGSTAKWTTYTYDDLGRVTQTTLPDSRVDTYSYNGLTRSATADYGGKNQTTSATLNAQGLNASVTDAASHTTSYVYDAFGDLASVTDPSGNVITNYYDIRGNKTDSYDPDMGHWTYVHDVLSQLVSQTDAKSQTTTLAYDVVGHPTSRSENNLVSFWTYGTSSSSHNVGKVTEAKACTTSGCSTVVADRTFSYDSVARPSSNALAIDGSNYTYSQGYDSYGRLSTVGYPSGFTALYTYTSLSYLSQIKDNGSGSAYWTANTRDAELHLLTATFGNGVGETNTFDANTGFLTNVRAGPSNSVANFDYTYDVLGNLTYRADGYEGTFEYACYDSLNRLTNDAAGNGVTSCTSSGTKTVAYDALGNITSKTSVGTYSYPSSGSAHPHAVSGITGTVNGVVNPTYTYDANGFMTAGDGRTVTPTAFNMAASIVQGSVTVSLTYDSEHQRVKMTAPSGTTYYLNDPATGSMEEKLVSGSTATWHDYLMADGGIVAEKFSGGTSAVRYVVTDHLGSTAVVTNESGSVVERDAYDPWGKRRNLDGSDDTTCSLASLTTRGFTGHEHIDSECLINANARIYDPTIARFMSADSMVPDPFDGQAFNRYSYVDNNPLSATDPSGNTPLVLMHPGGDSAVYSHITGIECWGNCFWFMKDDGKVDWNWQQVGPMLAALGFDMPGMPDQYRGGGQNHTYTSQSCSGDGSVCTPIHILHYRGASVWDFRQADTGQIDTNGVALAQTAPAIPEILGACARSPILCGAAVLATAAAVIYGSKIKVKSQSKTDDMVLLYRAVGPVELESIEATKQYSLLPGGSEVKWFTVDLAMAKAYLSDPKMGAIAVTQSYVSRTTYNSLAPGYAAGEGPFVTAEAPQLGAINADAARSGGVQVAPIYQW